jgi:hypothetical protein
VKNVEALANPEALQPRQVDARHLPAQEWQSRQSLVPGRSRHLAFDGKR